MAFAVILGKEVFGGTGMNIWNPALIARAFLFFAYPSHMSGDKVWVAGVDGYSGATPLAEAAIGNFPTMANGSDSILNMFIGLMPGCPGETSTIAIDFHRCGKLEDHAVHRCRRSCNGLSLQRHRA